MLQEERRLLVCGSRTITDKNWIYSQIESYWYEHLACYSNPIMIEGAARGVDLIAKAYAVENDWKVEEYPADWSIGKQAGILRNIKMYKNTDEVLVLWDGESRGTRHTIELCKKGNKPYTIIIYPHDFYNENTIKKNYN